MNDTSGTLTGGTLLCHSCKKKVQWSMSNMLGMSTKTGKAMLVREANMLIAKLTQYPDGYGFGAAGYYLTEHIKMLKRFVWFKHMHKDCRIQVLRANEQRPEGAENYKKQDLPNNNRFDGNWNKYGEWIGGYPAQ